MKSLETQLHEALEQIKVKDAQILSLKQAVHERQVAYTKVIRDGMLASSGLPDDARKRIAAAFANSTNNDGVRQAINVEKRKAGVQ